MSYTDPDFPQTAHPIIHGDGPPSPFGLQPFQCYHERNTATLWIEDARGDREPYWVFNSNLQLENIDFAGHHIPDPRHANPGKYYLQLSVEGPILWGPAHMEGSYPEYGVGHTVDEGTFQNAVINNINIAGIDPVPVPANYTGINQCNIEGCGTWHAEDGPRWITATAIPYRNGVLDFGYEATGDIDPHGAQPSGGGAPSGSGNAVSAYDLWLQEGNTGAIPDFLASLKGEAGVGLPPGGIIGQSLVKQSGADHDAVWGDIEGMETTLAENAASVSYNDNAFHTHLTLTPPPGKYMVTVNFSALAANDGWFQWGIGLNDTMTYLGDWDQMPTSGAFAPVTWSFVKTFDGSQSADILIKGTGTHPVDVRNATLIAVKIGD